MAARVAISKPVTIAYNEAPQAKGRARFGKGRVFTPPATRQFERDFGWRASVAMAGRPPLTGALTVTALFTIEIPKSWPATRRASAIIGSLHPTVKPDLDNLVKAALDAVRGIVIADDAQVVAIAARKAYGVTPGTVLTAAPLNDGAKMAPNPARLLQEVSAAPTRCEARKLFEDAGEGLADMAPHERELAYEQITDIIAEKPE